MRNYKLQKKYLEKTKFIIRPYFLSNLTSFITLKLFKKKIVDILWRHFTFRYKNTSFVVAKLNEPWVEFVRDTVVSTCSITASPCCSNLPFRVISWTAVNGLHSNGIVVYLLKRRLTLIYSFLYLLPKYRFYGRCSGILCFLSTAVLHFFLDPYFL